MATFYIHSYLCHKLFEKNVIPDEFKAIFHLGCFAPDLPAHTVTKKKTHYVHGLSSYPLIYNIKRFKKENYYNSEIDETQKWFLKGYLYHLFIDSVWWKFYGQKFMNRNFYKLNREKKKYYNGMSKIDKYIRHHNGKNKFEDLSLKLFQDIDFPMEQKLLDIKKLIEIIECMEFSKYESAEIIDRKLIFIKDDFLKTINDHEMMILTL